ncbi:hypothetical protein BGW36DRAFT_365524 [Talaromyces proteolyticus]|uniref:Uncharacterized protein n=1 Tax=Talaromyces proteolyticus TaxID=1131652 RepID=A0AAD4KDB8_9EURO|nr:uncharacterized protein BGW36DRAFT_365524 [Talaromyces proteolyticus]KAH8688990.1 hypothetical protein BGW36DRAFT_365524 [Talaromyces proteolyticus]
MYTVLEGPHSQFYMHNTPWATIILIFIMLCCMGVSAGVIVVSNNQAVDSWRISPAVLLAFFSSVWSSSLAAVLTMSITITWWRYASRGTTLETLHCIWKRGFAIRYLSALKSSPIVRQVVLVAWIVIITQVAHNSLLQRSSQTTLSNAIVPDNITLDIMPQIPDGWLGYVYNATQGIMVGSRNSLSSIQDWWMNKTISTIPPLNSNRPVSDFYCDGSCRGRVRGAGISYECSSTSRNIDLLDAENTGTFIFSINSTLSSNLTSAAPSLTLSVLYSSEVDANCISTLTLRTCSIEAATVEYPIVIENSTVALEKTKLDPPIVVEKYSSDGDSLTAKLGQGAGPLQGIHAFVDDILTTNVSLIVGPNGARQTGRFVGDIFFEADESAYLPETIHLCGLKWSDPTLYVLDAMQDFLFRASISSASNSTNTNSSQTFRVERTAPILVFQSNYGFLVAALATMLLALGAVISQLWGWWDLRHCLVSLSPIEVANAFSALETKRPDGYDLSNSQNINNKGALTVDNILDVVGKTTVRYDGQSFRGSAVVPLSGRPMSLSVNR